MDLNRINSTSRRSLTLELNGVTYNDLMPRDYVYDLETEEVIYGNDLVEGMTVLPGFMGRVNLSIPISQMFSEIAVRNNRWAMVTDLRRSEENKIYFMAVYADGRKLVQKSKLYHEWIAVKQSANAVAQENLF